MSDPMDAKGAVPEGTQESASYLRLPWYVVTAALVLVVGGTLAFGLYATRASREPVAAPPTPLPSATAAATPIAATAAPPIAPTITPAPTPLIVNLAPTATSVPAGATATPIETSATPNPTAPPTVEPTLAAEVGAAYERYWGVRAQALLDLDKSHLAEAMDGDHLASTANLIDELHSENRAIKTVVDHDYLVEQAQDSSAQVFDDYLSSSFYVEPGTLKAISSPSSDELKVLYKMMRIDGVWKVVDSVRAE